MPARNILSLLLLMFSFAVIGAKEVREEENFEGIEIVIPGEDIIVIEDTDSLQNVEDGHSSLFSQNITDKIEKPRHCNDEYFNGRQLIAPAALIAVGAAGVWLPTFRQLDEDVKDGMTHLRHGHYFHADDYLQLVPAAVYFGLGFFNNVKTKHTFKQRLMVELTAFVAMAAITNGIKYTVREPRPDSGARNSFPSGHTATAFTGAELIREEYGNGWGAGAYIFSTGIAFLRLYNERHWLNDVIAGAGVGILCARIGYWMLPLYNKWFHWEDKPNKPLLTVMPSYDATTRSGGISMGIVF